MVVAMVGVARVRVFGGGVGCVGVGAGRELVYGKGVSSSG